MSNPRGVQSTSPTPPLAGVALVFAGGALGALCRGLLDALAHQTHLSFLALAWSTILVNLLGAYLLGTINASASAKLSAGGNVARISRLKLLFGTGFMGSFTTYSTFALVIHQNLVSSHGVIGTLVEALLLLALGVGAAALGWWGANRTAPPPTNPTSPSPTQPPEADNG